MKPVFVGMPEPQKKPEIQPVTQRPEQKGLLHRIAEIISDDIQYYLHGIKSEQRQRWEDYERFCELSRRK